MMPGVLTFDVLIFALSKAQEMTIVNLVIWGVVFPALVTGLIAFAVIRAIGERQENDEHGKHRRRQLAARTPRRTRVRLNPCPRRRATDPGPSWAVVRNWRALTLRWTGCDRPAPAGSCSTASRGPARRGC